MKLANAEHVQLCVMSRAQLALADPLSCNSLLYPPPHTLHVKQTWICAESVGNCLTFLCVCRVVQLYSHTQMQGVTARSQSVASIKL